MVTADELKAARLALGDSQEAFGSRFGVDQSTVHRWETEGPPMRGPARILISQLIDQIRERAN